ncbi:hypothetical protein [Prevotella corporis]|uniref:hypothetical protein n=1 Tax=Prevotella corporis TaxID=28128 RepID=UPI0023F70EB8|nr:hypothetical protein [Prevotella corporis]
MEKKELLEKVRELNNVFSEDLDKKLEKMLESGCVDLSKYDNGFILPKIIFSAILKSESFQFAPMSKEYQQEIKNVSKFL